jgi:hypothetical protein
MWCSVSWRDGSFEHCIVGADEKRSEGKRRVGEAHGRDRGPLQPTWTRCTCTCTYKGYVKKVFAPLHFVHVQSVNYLDTWEISISLRCPAVVD